MVPQDTIPTTHLAFPYYSVYFKANEYIVITARVGVFPYYSVYFKALLNNIFLTSLSSNFHTIQSILKLFLGRRSSLTIQGFPYYSVYFKASLCRDAIILDCLDFHTIQSILKQDENREHKPHKHAFPYYSVYFKALLGGVGNHSP